MARDDLRTLLVRILDWEDAHVNFDRAVDGVPPAKRGVVPPGFAWSLWQLVEHIRLVQFDILDFCRNEQYVEPSSMSAYWPSSAEPPSDKHWDDAIAAVKRDREDLKALGRDEAVDLFARVPAGTGQTFLRELLLVADHTAYHVGQIVAVRRALGNWNG
jgi:uncharacterized damage-inducible protein DinB